MELFDLGFLGGGQLARMSIHAAQRMGVTCLSLENGESTPASQVAPAIQGALNDPLALAELIRRCRKITLENEFIPAPALREAFQLAGRDPGDLLPGIETLETIQDKLLQRRALEARGIPSPTAMAFEDPATVVAELGFPMVLKTRFGGYDGKGTRIVRNQEELEECTGLTGWLAERFVPFRREVAVMVVRTPGGTVRMEPVETVQPQAVCDHTFPANWRGEPRLGTIPEDAIAAVGGYGLFGVELFELEDGQILVNEIAPRPHNTGHYSMDWGGLSQFDLHVRAVLGLPIPAQILGSPVMMMNLLGRSDSFDLKKGWKQALDHNPDARIHWYGKGVRPGRKLGHINIPARGLDELAGALETREAFWA